jgi:hypothetical protein
VSGFGLAESREFCLTGWRKKSRRFDVIFFFSYRFSILKSISFFVPYSFHPALHNFGAVWHGASILDTPKPFCDKS